MLFFVHYFIKYTWLCFLKNKSDVTSIFEQFKSLVECYFFIKIQIVYTDGSGEATTLSHFRTRVGIRHLNSPPDSPKHTGIAERKYHHIVEIALTLHASLPLKYWSLAFQATVYLINRMPSLVTPNKSPFSHLFKQSPNYLSLKTFDCLCYLWL